MENRRYTVVAPTTGGTVWIERIRARPRLQASYAALKGDFRPLALSADYHNFVGGPLSAHGIVEGAHELLITEDIDSGRSWEIPVLIAHLLASEDKLHKPDGDAYAIQPDIIWATGSVDPELHPQGADYSVARKCEIAAELFAGWKSDGRTVHVIVPGGMPASDVAAITDAANANGFQLSIVDNLSVLKSAIGFSDIAKNEPDDDVTQPSPVHAKDLPAWRIQGTRIAGAVAAVAAIGLGLNALLSDASTSTSGNTTEGSTSPVTLMRLGASNRSDCIERIMLTQPMNRTTIPMIDGKYAVSAGEGLCGLRFVNQSPNALSIRLTGDLVTAAIQGNDALFQGVNLPANDAINLIFSRPANGLTASLQLDDAAIPVVIEQIEATEQ